MRTLLAAALLVAAAAGGWLTYRAVTGTDEPGLRGDAPALPGEAPALPDEAPARPDGGPALPNEEIAFTLPDLEGNPRSLSEWEGKARLVNFWATWCAPCRREIPLLKEVQAEHEDLQVIGVAVDYRDDVLAYAETADFNYPILIGRDDAIAAAESSGVRFIGLPFTMVITADGRLVKTHMGEILEKHIDRIVDVLARLESGDLDLAGAREALGHF